MTKLPAAIEAEKEKLIQYGNHCGRCFNEGYFAHAELVTELVEALEQVVRL